MQQTTTQVCVVVGNQTGFLLNTMQVAFLSRLY